ncbi:MAG TPA: extracellular solute-binding protein [Actinopolymorphaceae bacterium]
MRGRVLTTLILAGAMALGACGSGDEGSSDGKVTITLAGPNQWNENPKSFGPAWEKLVSEFEQTEKDIEVRTTVLPLSSFNETISTRLAAGTAPELVFNQASYKPYMVRPLDEYLKKPNPYVPGNERWIDLFREEYYGWKYSKGVNAEGHIEFVPFNLVGVAVFYNKDAFDEAGVGPPETFAELMTTCGKLRAAGYTPFAMDNSDIGTGWTVSTISNMLFAKYFDQLNDYGPDNEPGKAEQLTAKSWAKAILTGEISATRTPEAAETLRLLKQFYDTCVTENWSGVTGTQGAVVGLREFSSGKAAMAWGVNFGLSALEDVDFPVASMPFPTITEESSELSTDWPAQFGVSTGGTSYMIPSTVEGEKLEAAVKFLQFASAPEHIDAWLEATGGIPALRDVEPSEATAGFLEGGWGEPMKVGGIPAGPPGTTVVSVFDGWLLGSKSRDQALAHLQDMWDKSQAKAVEDNGWTDEPWAKKAG